MRWGTWYNARGGVSKTLKDYVFNRPETLLCVNCRTTLPFSFVNPLSALQVCRDQQLTKELMPVPQPPRFR